MLGVKTPPKVPKRPLGAATAGTLWVVSGTRGERCKVPGGGKHARMSDLSGKIGVVTGANSGIGKAMTADLARRGARVIMICRSKTKAEAAKAEVEAATGSEEVELLLADLSLLSQIERVAGELRERTDRIDFLMNNAGVYMPERVVTEEGHELTFATNHLGMFALTLRVLDLVEASEAGRIVATSSIGHKMGRPNLEDLNLERSTYRQMPQYCNTKLHNVLFIRELARRLTEKGSTIRANCFHPGAVGTGFGQDKPGLFNALMKVGKIFLRSPEKGAETGLFLATSRRPPPSTASTSRTRRCAPPPAPAATWRRRRSSGRCPRR